jgi:polysaccharide biosynthesis/export protein
MRLHKTSLLLIVCLLLSLPVAGVAQQESLLIGPGDMLHVVVFDEPELEQHARVTDSGELPLLMGGNVKVAALTPEAAAAAIEKALVDGHYLVHPRISLTVEQYATQNISIIGAVKNPGAYPITTGRTVPDAIALAGGLADDASRNIVIQRHGTGELLTYFLSNDPTVTPDASAPGANVTKNGALLSRATIVYPGDTIRVARADLVFALGDMGRPGGFPVVNNDAPLTVLQLVAIAGGTNKTAAPGRARLLRKAPDGSVQDIPISISDMQKGKVPDRSLQANDILYVPFSFMKNASLGVVAIAAAATGAAIYATR